MVGGLGVVLVEGLGENYQRVANVEMSDVTGKGFVDA